MKKKVVFITNYLGKGGIQRVISIIANYFVFNDVEVDIVATYSDIIDYELSDKINYICILDSKKGFRRIIERAFKLRKFIRALNSDAVIISFSAELNIYTVITSLFLNKKIILSQRNDPENEFKGQKLKQWLRDFCFRISSKVVFQTLDEQKYFSRSVQKKSVIIPNPINSALPERHREERRKEIAAVCRLSAQKNIKMMIDAYVLLMKDYPEFILTIYGEGDRRQELEEYIDKLSLKDKIFMPGFKKDVYERVVDSYMYVSSSDYEGISNSMLEALGMGLPSLVTDCPAGGAKMFIKQNENGILVPVGDVQAMYRGMKKIIEDDKFREKISTNAVKIKDELNIDIICKKWLDLIGEI